MRGRECGFFYVGVALALVPLAACGSDGADGSSCSVSPGADGTAVIACDDGSEVTIEPGEGPSGPPGDSCSVTPQDDGSALVECTDGSSATVPPGPAGPPGEPGPTGDAGPQGPPGTTGPAFGVAGVGVSVTVEEVTVDAERHPIVKLLITDSAGVGLDAGGVLSSGATAFRFTFGHVPVASDSLPGPYVNYMLSGSGQPSDERGSGEWTLLDPTSGAYEYRFELQLPESYDAGETHVLSVLAERSLGGVTYLDHDVHRFVPNDSGATPLAREVSMDDTCNGCHTRLTVHGDHRSGYQVCLTCHSQDAVDPESGNSIAFNQMLHKIHMGDQLLSSKAGDETLWYKITGYGGRNIFFNEVHFPQVPNNCAACHTGADAGWLDARPSIEACGSCHEDVWFGKPGEIPESPAGYDGTKHPDYAGGAPVPFYKQHRGGEQLNGSCGGCHSLPNPILTCDDPPSPSGSEACDSYTAHYNQITDPNAVTLWVNNLQVTAADGGSEVVLSFDANTSTVSAGEAGATTPVALADLANVRVLVAGPNEEYANTARVQFTQNSDPTKNEIEISGGPGSFTAKLLSAPSGDVFTWSDLAAAVGLSDPANESVTFSVRASIKVNSGLPNQYDAHTINPTVGFALPTSTSGVTTRREVVSDDRCNACHEDLRYTHGHADLEYSRHGGSYRSVKQCNMCHMAQTTRPRAGNRLGPMIHRIHGSQFELDDGELVLNPATGQPVAADTGYPGDPRNCEQCHLPGTYSIKLPGQVLASAFYETDALPADYYLAPMTHFCTGCHNAPTTKAHAEINTLGDVGNDPDTTEVCGTCHGDGQTFGVDTVHARLEDE